MSDADVFRAAIDKDEIRLQFGQTQPSDPSIVAVTRCVVLSPKTALRLRSRLRDALREAERRARSSPREVAAAMGKMPVNAPPDPAGERAARLYRLVEALGVGYLQERSFRLAQEMLLANRVLLSVGRQRLGADAPQRVLAICAALGMPDAIHDELRALVAGASAVHFGFEDESGRALYKVYCERQEARDEAARAAPGSAVLLHLAHKWDAEDAARHVQTRYHWYPRLTAAALRQRMGQASCAAVLPAAEAILDLACTRAAPERLQYLEVSETGNERRSFDLNVYDAQLTLRDIQAPLARLRDHFGIRPGRLQGLLDQVSAKRFGHFAAGMHRDGKGFATVYYGGESRG